MKVSSLFILGNGFDRAHGMETSYEDFQKYLKRKYPNANDTKLIIPSGTQMPKGDVKYDDDDVVSFLMYLISQAEEDGDNWSDLESSLGRLSFDECLYNSDPVVDQDGDYDSWKNMYIRQDVANDLVIPCLMIKEYFADWINTIPLKNIKPKEGFMKLIDKDSDLFFTFNYTETLEIIYKVKNVCHIHGKRGEKLIFGHGNDNDYLEEYISEHPGAEDSLISIQEALRKNTKDALADHADFFDNIPRGLNKVYSFGFSFSEVDRIYIEELCKRVNTESVIWYLHSRSSGARRSFESIIRKCGFKGQFSTFDIYD